LHHEGLLLVNTVRPTEIFVNGVHLGPTGTTHSVLCGRKFVRLGRTPGPSWTSIGYSVEIPCRRLARVVIPLNPE
jgi:hypothetical protein